MNPKYQIGRQVLHPRTGRLLTVLQRKFNKSVTATAIKVGMNGALYTDTVTLPDYWSYKLSDGKAYWYQEQVLEAPSQSHEL